MNDEYDYNKLFDLTGKNIIVIGAANGIGMESSKAIAAHNANLICADINLDKTKLLVTKLSDLYDSKIIPHHIDITDRNQIIDLINSVDTLDGIVCTPSINVRKLIKDYTETDFDKVLNLNLKSTFNVLQLAANKMIPNNKGSIIAFSSIRGTVVEPGQSVYAASKAATEKIINTLASEIGEYNVRANTISPGPVKTDLTNQLRSDKRWNNAYTNKPALKRWAEPYELAGGIVYLLSDASSYVTGSNLRIDGGWTSHDGRFDPKL